MPEHPERRKTDILFKDNYMEGLADRTIDELKAMRDECAEAENEISFERRLCQARLDILSAELDHREGRAGDVISRLPEILAQEGGGNSTLPKRAPDMSAPEGADKPRRRVEEIVGEQTLARLADLDVEEIRTIIDKLAEHERNLSRDRRHLHEMLDQIQAEMVGRYTRGEANPDAILG
ncbi:MAG TPA: hypothetical protein VNP73_05735 [Actinomycetota bacterium]|nr:hypothetical protein [Actinomycetota bacterium]